MTCYARAVSTFAPTVPANLMNARFVSTVVVELVAARNVLAADKAGDSDPYVTFVVEGAADQKKLKSKVVPDNVNPEWNQVSEARKQESYPRDKDLLGPQSYKHIFCD